HLNRPPKPLSERVAGVPPELDELVLNLLAKSPRDRIGHAADVAAVLVRLGAEDDAPLGPKPRAYLYRPGFAGRREPILKIDERLARLKTNRGGFVAI